MVKAISVSGLWNHGFYTDAFRSPFCAPAFAYWCLRRSGGVSISTILVVYMGFMGSVNYRDPLSHPPLSTSKFEAEG